MEIKRYDNLKVLILGLGINRGGLGATQFFARNGAKVKVTDLKTAKDLQPMLDELKEFPDIEYTLGEHKFEDLDWADLIIRNPALKPDNQYLKYAEEKGKRVEMDMGILLEYVKPSQIIGITGTKGKSTTSSLIYQILKFKMDNVVFAGNIGKSVFDLIPVVDEHSLIVLELSSFHLQAFEQHQTSPKYSVVTNISPDHLNYHGTMENYIEAKRAIVTFQDEDGVVILRKNDPITDTEDFKKDLRGKIIYFSKDDLPKDFQTLLPGEHNKENLAAAIKMAEQFGVDVEQSQAAIKDFRGVDFRLQLVKIWQGTKIYNDSAATTPIATIQALKSLPSSILIVGGMSKDISYEELAHTIDRYAKEVYFLDGDATEEIKKHLKSDAMRSTYSNLEDLLKDVKQNLSGRQVILFSPGATSFNLFQNEFDRGRKFNAALEKIFKED